MHEQTRVKALLTKMNGYTATLAEIQAITDIDPLVVRAALVNLQKQGEVYFTGKVYGCVFESNNSSKVLSVNLTSLQKEAAFKIAASNCEDFKDEIESNCVAAVKALKLIEQEG